MCCFLISDEPGVEDKSGRRKIYETAQKFQVAMLDAPCIDGWRSWAWCCGQFIPCTCGCTQYLLRKKVLEEDMTKYQCCQGYVDTCGFKAGSCGEADSPDCCLFCEGCCCNGCAVSASRMVVQDRYQLSTDPCDYRLIRISNCLMILSCFCDICAIFDPSYRDLACIIDCIAEIFYHAVSGCMTAQVAHEMNFQLAQDKFGVLTVQAVQAPYAPPVLQEKDPGTV